MTDAEYDQVVEQVTANVGSEQQRKALKELYRPLYRKLAQEYHPDKGGDIETFNEIKRAYKSGNYPYLEELYATRILARKPYWRATEGFKYTRNMMLMADQRFELLRNLPSYHVLMAHRAGNRDEALRITGLILADTLMNLELDIAEARLSARHAAKASRAEL